ALAVEFVDRDKIGEIQHIDLLQLACRAELWCHDVERDIHQGHDAGITLADARRLDDYKVEARQPAHPNHFAQRGCYFSSGAAGGEGTHVDMGMVDRIHADTVAEQSAAGPPACGIYRQHRDLEPVVLVEPHAADELV